MINTHKSIQKFFSTCQCILIMREVFFFAKKLSWVLLNCWYFAFMLHLLHDSVQYLSFFLSFTPYLHLVLSTYPAESLFLFGQRISHV